MMCHVASWLEPINHDIRVELVEAGLERYRIKGLFQSVFRVIKVGDNEEKVMSCLSPKCFLKDAEKRSEGSDLMVGIFKNNRFRIILALLQVISIGN